jgi:hypothetical protein
MYWGEKPGPIPIFSVKAKLVAGSLQFNPILGGSTLVEKVFRTLVDECVP